MEYQITLVQEEKIGAHIEDGRRFRFIVFDEKVLEGVRKGSREGMEGCRKLKEFKIFLFSAF